MTDRGPLPSFLMDMDGVLVHEEQAIPGAGRFLEALQTAGLPLLVLTNNSIYTQRDLAARLARSGIELPPEAVWTSALATTQFLDTQRPGGTASVIEGRLTRLAGPLFAPPEGWAACPPCRPEGSRPMNADNPFPGERTAVITGAASPRGIGRATADRLARDGWSIAILDLDDEAAKRTAAEIAGHRSVASLGIAADVSDEDSVEAAIARVEAKKHCARGPFRCQNTSGTDH